MSVQQATSLEQLAYTDKPVVVTFTNSLTCVPCKQFKPHFAAAADELSDRVTFLEVDIIDNIDIAAAFGVMSTPTVVFIGVDSRKTLNSRTALALLDEINELL